eukprot:1179465-Prorocentrum_minimum.AAC.10
MPESKVEDAACSTNGCGVVPASTDNVLAVQHQSAPFPQIKNERDDDMRFHLATSSLVLSRCSLITALTQTQHAML